jgi:hypothetical protein
LRIKPLFLDLTGSKRTTFEHPLGRLSPLH